MNVIEAVLVSQLANGYTLGHDAPDVIVDRVIIDVP